MPEFDNPQAIFSMMSSLLGGGQAQQPFRYTGAPSHFTSAYRYQPGMFEWVMDYLMPNRQRLAPPTVLQSDWQQMMSMSKLRSRNQFSSINPTALQSVNMVLDQFTGGQGAQTLFDFQKSQPFLYNSLVAPAMSFMFGPGVSQSQNRAFEDVHRYFSGTMFRPGDSYRLGMPVDVAKQVTTGLYNMTYKDTNPTALFRRFQNFGVGDMSDIMRLGLDYGMQTPLNAAGGVDVNRLVKQTEGLAKVIDAAMAVYRTLDKEKALQGIIELTSGRIPITDTASLENVLYRVNAMAKNISVSTQYMQQVGVEGARMFEGLGLSGQAGSMYRMGVMTAVRRMTDTPGAGFTPEESAFLGGRQAIGNRYAVMGASFMSSRAFRNAALMYSAADQGLIDMTPGSVMDALQAGEVFDVKDVTGVRKAIRRNIRSTKGLENISDNIVDSMVDAQIMQLRASDKLDMALNESGGLGAVRTMGTLMLQETLGPELWKGQTTLTRMSESPEYSTYIESLVTSKLKQRGFSDSEARAHAMQMRRAALITPEMVRAENLQRITTQIVDQSSQHMRERTSIARNLQGMVAFKGHEGLVSALALGLPGSSFAPLVDYRTGKKMTEQDMLDLFSMMGNTPEALAKNVLVLSGNKELEAITHGLVHLTGMGAFEITPYRQEAVAMLETIEKRQGQYKGLTERERRQQYSRLGNLVGGDKFSVESADQFFSQSDHSYRATMEYLNSILPDGEKYTLDSFMKSEFGRQYHADRLKYHHGGLANQQTVQTITNLRQIDKSFTSTKLLAGEVDIETALGGDYTKMLMEVESTILGANAGGITMGVGLRTKEQLARANTFYYRKVMDAKSMADKQMTIERKNSFKSQSQMMILSSKERAKAMIEELEKPDLTYEESKLAHEKMKIHKSQSFLAAATMTEGMLTANQKFTGKSIMAMFDLEKAEISKDTSVASRQVELARSMPYIQREFTKAAPTFEKFMEGRSGSLPSKMFQKAFDIGAANIGLFKTQLTAATVQEPIGESMNKMSEAINGLKEFIEKNGGGVAEATKTRLDNILNELVKMSGNKAWLELSLGR